MKRRRRERDAAGVFINGVSVGHNVNEHDNKHITTLEPIPVT